jgi:hypothetical protein
MRAFCDVLIMSKVYAAKNIFKTGNRSQAATPDNGNFSYRRWNSNTSATAGRGPSASMTTPKNKATRNHQTVSDRPAGSATIRRCFELFFRCPHGLRLYPRPLCSHPRARRGLLLAWAKQPTADHPKWGAGTMKCFDRAEEVANKTVLALHH